MSKPSFERVSFETHEPSRGGALIHIFRQRGRIVATVTQYRWHEPDGHEHTGIADLDKSIPRPADEVMAAYRKALAVIALENEQLWDPAWGRLR